MKDNEVIPVIGIGSTMETENGLATVVGFSGSTVTKSNGDRFIIPHVVLRDSRGNTFEVAGSVFEKLL